MQSLDDLLSHHSLVTFRYYAQHAGLPVTDAKEALREYADSHKGEVHVVHLLGGQRKTESGDGPLEYKLVPEEQLEKTKELFEPLTACQCTGRCFSRVTAAASSKRSASAARK